MPKRKNWRVVGTHSANAGSRFYCVFYNLTRDIAWSVASGIVQGLHRDIYFDTNEVRHVAQ